MKIDEEALFRNMQKLWDADDTGDDDDFAEALDSLEKVETIPEDESLEGTK